MPYMQNAMSLIIETLIGLYLIVVILRFLFQLFRVDFRNPVSQMVVSLTNPPLKFLRGFIPGMYGIDLAGIVLIIVVGTVKTLLLLAVSGFPFNFPGALVLSVAEIINTICWTLLIVILASAVLSWVAPHNNHPALRLVREMAYPILRPFQRILPAFGGIDLTPILALLAINLVQKLVVHPISDFGRSLFL